MVLNKFCNIFFNHLHFGTLSNSCFGKIRVLVGMVEAVERPTGAKFHCSQDVEYLQKLC